MTASEFKIGEYYRHSFVWREYKAYFYVTDVTNSTIYITEKHINKNIENRLLLRKGSDVNFISKCEPFEVANTPLWKLLNE